MNETLEYRCGCVYSNNRWFPECPRHDEWWSTHLGSAVESKPAKFKSKGACVLKCLNPSTYLNKLKDCSVKLFLTYPMFQYKTIEFVNDDLFTLMARKLKPSGVFCMMCDITNLASTITLLEASGLSVHNVINVLYEKTLDILIPSILVVATLEGKTLNCKNTYKRLPDLLYYSKVATSESFLVRTFTDKGDLVVDPFCTNIHTLDGTLHENRKFLGFCSSDRMFDKLKFYIHNFEADTDAFKFVEPEQVQTGPTDGT